MIGLPELNFNARQVSGAAGEKSQKAKAERNPEETES
jgi:hypothetical protein